MHPNQNQHHEHPKSCCPDGSWPALKVDYHPKGKKFNLADTTVYQVGEGNRVLIIVSDIFGATSARHESVADTYAEFGYNVYLPEVLVTPYDEGMKQSIMDVIAHHNDWNKVEARFKVLY